MYGEQGWWWGMNIHFNIHAVSSLFSPRTPNIGYSFETNSGNPFHYFSYGVACSEVEIDCLTGDHKVCCLQNSVLRGEEKRNNSIIIPKTNSVVGKIMLYITAWETPFKGPESKNCRLLGSQRHCLNSVFAAHRQPRPMGTNEHGGGALKRY